MMLAACGYTVVTAESGVEALELARHNRSPGNRGNHRSHGNRDIRRNRATQLARRCRHFPCQKGGTSPS